MPSATELPSLRAPAEIAADGPATESPRRQRRGRLLIALLIAACLAADAAVAVTTGLRPGLSKLEFWLMTSQIQVAFVWLILNCTRPLIHLAILIATLAVWWLILEPSMSAVWDYVPRLDDGNGKYSEYFATWMLFSGIPTLALLLLGARFVSAWSSSTNRASTRPFQFQLRTLLGWFFAASLLPLAGRFVDISLLATLVPTREMLTFCFAFVGVPIGTAVVLGRGRWPTVILGLIVSYGPCVLIDPIWHDGPPGEVVAYIAPYLTLYFLMLLVLRAAGYRLAYRPWWRRRVAAAKDHVVAPK